MASTSKPSTEGLQKKPNTKKQELQPVFRDILLENDLMVSVYGHATFTRGDYCVLFMATIKGIYWMDCNRTELKHLSLPPVDAEVISLATLPSNGAPGSDPPSCLLAVTYVHAADPESSVASAGPTGHLHIYALSHNKDTYVASHDVQVINLAYIPFQSLGHWHSGSMELLVCGSDKGVHRYVPATVRAVTRRQVEGTSAQTPANYKFVERTASESTTTATNTLPAVPMCVVVKTIRRSLFVTVVGCQNGSVLVSVRSTSSPEIQHLSWQCVLLMSGPVGSIACCESVGADLGPHILPPPEDFSVALATPVGACTVIENVYALATGLANPDAVLDAKTRPRVHRLSGEMRGALCVHCTDADMDGRLEILVGTYDAKILVFRLEGGGYRLVSVHTFPAPVYGLATGDVCGSGLTTLCVFSARGVHIMGPVSNEVIYQRINKSQALLRELCELRDIARSLTTENSPALGPE